MRKLLKILFWSALAFQVALFLIFGLPILGTLSAFTLADTLGCTLNASDVHVCLFMGVDIGERLYGYTIPLAGSLLTPITFIFSFFDVLLAANLICLVCWIGRRFTPAKNKFFSA